MIIQMPDGQKVRFPDNMPKEQINEMILTKYPELDKRTPRERSNAPEWMKSIADKMASEGRTELTTGEKAKIYLKALTGSSSDLIGRVSSGASFGGTDWVSRKAGVNPTEGIEDMIDNAKSDKAAGAVGLISGLTEMSGSFPTGSGLYSGVSKGWSSVPKVGKYLNTLVPSTATGAITGGAYGGFQTDSLEGAGKGATRGAIIGLATTLAGKGISKAISAAEKAKGVERGLPNVVQTSKGTRVLSRGVKESQEIAEQLYGEAPVAKQQINQRMAGELDKSIGRRVDIGKTHALQEQKYADFMNKNGDMNALNGRDLYSGLNQYQQKALNTALKTGKEMTTSKYGSLNHINETKKVLNDMIEKSKTQTFIGSKATNETNNLSVVKKRVDSLLSDSGTKALDKSYSKVYRLQDAYEQGAKFNQNNLAKQPNFKTTMEKRAFAEGLKDKILNNTSNKNLANEVLKNQDALKQVLPKNSFESLVKQARTNNLSYDRLNTLEKAAARKTGAAEPIAKNTGPIRETLETIGSAIGATADTVRRAATVNSSVKASRYLLNPEMKMGRPFYDTVQKYLPSASVIFTESKTKRKENK